jgi:hypothetical protein
MPFFRGAYVDTGHCSMTTKVKYRISVNIQTRKNFGTKIYNLMKLNDVEIKE